MPTLDWIGKSKVVNHHLDVPYCVLDRKYSYDENGQHEEDNGSENMIIHGDNLLALKSLLPQYEGRINCIYIDPPYNTGNENWVYNDNVNDPRIKKWLGEVVGKEGEDLSRHDKWLCMMYPRLKLLHRLLAEDGVIFISIDDTEVANLLLICNEIFGANYFMGDIIWQHSVQSNGYGGKFVSQYNHTIVYSKSEDFILKNLPRTDEDNKLYKNPDNDPRGAWRAGYCVNGLVRPNLMYDVETPSGKIIPSPSKGWRWSKETMLSKMATGEIIFNKDESNIIHKLYLADLEGKVPTNIWANGEAGTTRQATSDLKEIFGGKAPFDTTKPVQLIERIIQISSEKDSVILDSFAGSGTTAHAVLNMNKQDGGNRKFIMIEMMDYADTITAERVRRVTDGYGEGKKAVPGTGGSFSYYELGAPIFNGDVLNEDIGEDEIRKYVYFTETKQPLEPRKADEPYYMGTHMDVSYYFNYEKDSITTLNRDFLHSVKTKAEGYVMYADLCTLSPRELEKWHITFKKIPRDISRL